MDEWKKFCIFAAQFEASRGSAGEQPREEKDCGEWRQDMCETAAG
jgi:hypothetical protein